MATPQTITLNVPDMECDHCVATINDTLRQQAGVAHVTVALPTKTVSLTYDPDHVTVATIEAALDDAGYPVAK